MKKDQRSALIAVISALCISVALAALDVEEQAALKAIRDHVPGLTTWSDTVISEACQTYSSPSYTRCSDGHISEMYVYDLATTPSLALFLYSQALE